ncbi:ribosomal protein S2, flavodoxin-like domain-containing protein [Crepidotus variabilis]|uniref:Ribosomal protein S2, flavodoxin-like domain-containing protein n=1 Tax=Crepidotus variabilis TaxID=179855 RepID=A0A9P6JTU2_9AGAR|nr:ribosomal protein S2, flavodoxin-like domain-containing protein [Crepidotus variabilis]
MSVLKPWLNVARCSSRMTVLTSGTQLRSQSTTTEHRLQTPEDWLAFRKEREERKGLMDLFGQYGSTTNAENTFRIRDGLGKPQAHATTSALLAAGAHFGHASTRMNPNFVPYAYGTRAGITIIDLDHSVPLLRRAANLTRAVARAGGIIVFIGTRPDLKPIVHKASERMGKQGYHVGDRWLPGTLSNRRNFFGAEVDNHRMIPDLVVFLNPVQNTIAINECAAEHVPTIGVIDSNVDPRLVMYPIPANDENTRTAELIAGVLSIAGREGVALRDQDLAAEARHRQKNDRIRKLSSKSESRN